jgi:glutaredoxin/glutathione-dependent peroxiredoxin
MSLSVGDTIPDVAVTIPGDDGMPKPAQTGELLGTGKVVLFAVPGAFTPGCSNFHLPGFVLRADEVKAKGVDVIACIAVNDAFVMHAWSNDQDAGAIQMIGDGNGAFTKAVGLEFDGSGIGLGTRSQRYAAILQDGVVQQLFVEPKPGVDVSSVENVLAHL